MGIVINSKNNSNSDFDKSVSVKKSRFTEMLIEANELDQNGFENWIFCNGMLAYSDDSVQQVRRKSSAQSGARRPLIPGEGVRKSERSDVDFFINLRLFVLSQIRFLFAHRFPFQINSICIVDEPIQDGIGNRRITDNLMPVINRQLACDQR